MYLVADGAGKDRRVPGTPSGSADASHPRTEGQERLVESLCPYPGGPVCATAEHKFSAERRELEAVDRPVVSQEAVQVLLWLSRGAAKNTAFFGADQVDAWLVRVMTEQESAWATADWDVVAQAVIHAADAWDSACV